MSPSGKPIAPLVSDSSEFFVCGWIQTAGRRRWLRCIQREFVAHDGSWVRTFHDPCDPLAQASESGSDPAESAAFIATWHVIAAFGEREAGSEAEDLAS